MNSKVIRKIKGNTFIYLLWDWVNWKFAKNQIKKDLRIIPNKLFKMVFGRELNWDNPKNLIEKIYWLQVYTDTSLWSRCSDKIEVLNYVKEKDCGDILNTFYDSWSDANDIEWDKLPNSFVLKSNNSCGKVIIVKNKSELNIPKTIKKLNGWLKIKYGYKDGQYHYTKIKPRIFAEKLLINEDNPDTSLIDYKVWCFNGAPECILVVFNRTQYSYQLSSYDLNWNNISKKSFKSTNKHVSGIDFPKPKCLDYMLECARKLSNGITQVRVDFYQIKEKVIFGEMTFTTGYGYYSDEFYEYLGSKIDLNNVKKLENKKIIIEN